MRVDSIRELSRTLLPRNSNKNEAVEEEPHIPLMERVPKLCPPLTELCVEVLAANFKDNSNFTVRFCKLNIVKVSTRFKF